MRVCGIDCGSVTTGYGVVEWDDRAQQPELTWLASGGISPPKKTPLPQRLALIHASLCTLFEQYRPDTVAVEEVFFSVNAKSAIKLGHVRGVALLAAANSGLPVAEYAPLTIKSTVTGYGLAAKEQVQFMVARLLRLASAPEPADAADALAIAICHIHHAQTLSLQEARNLAPRRTMNGKLPALLLLSLLAVAARAASAQTSAEATPQPAPATAQILYTFHNPELQPARYTIAIDENGQGHFTSEPGHAAVSRTSDIVPAPMNRSIHIDRRLRTALFRYARSHHFFNERCATRRKNLAFTGSKTLTYTGPDGHGSCAFVWAVAPALQSLSDQLDAVAYTLEIGRRLGLEVNYDRLSIDSELQTLATAVKDRQASDIANIAPVLRTIAADNLVMDRARQRAGALLSQEKSSRKHRK